MKPCDNFSRTHNLELCSEDDNCARLFCRECGNYVLIRKDYDGKYNKKQSDEAFKRFSIQPQEPLFYKYYPQHLRK